MNDLFSTNSRLPKNWRLFSFLFIFTVCAVPKATLAHPSPNSIVLLDVRADRVAMELQLPVPELELAFGAINDPETLIETLGPQLKEYLRAHIHAYVTKGNPWQVEIESLKMDKGKYMESDVSYWEVIAQVLLKPQPNEIARAFTLDYDVIMHQVINHAAFVSIRNDWDAGVDAEHPVEIGVIHVDTGNNTIAPLIINQGGSTWTGFKNMVTLGIKHIAEGTDHLLFLLVLLLSAPLVAAHRKWAHFGGTRYSLINLFKIVTAFTIGHSITLMAGAWGWFHVPGQPVEILIAFSILVSAIHALRPIFSGREAYVAAGFGLIHGMAFAGTLENLNLAPTQMALSIFGFNMGIELMQLIVIAFIVPWLIMLSRFSLYKKVRIGGSIAGGIAAVAWMTERILTRSNPVTLLVEQLVPYAPWIILILAASAIYVSFQSQVKIGNK
jgi:hypothetical protein